MKSSFTHFICFLFLGSIVLSCDEIIDPDISKEKVFLFSPVDSATITTNAVLFTWDPVYGAAKYRLELVSPLYNKPVTVILDTFLTATQFSLQVTKGIYQWTVTAYNNTAIAYGDIYNLTVTQGTDLSQYTVLNLAPSDTLSNSTVTMLWDKVYSATGYIVSIWSPTWQRGVEEKKDTVYTNQYNYTFKDGVYAWGVKAINDSTETKYSVCSLVIDLKP
ncbi:MAG: hypothetical protein JXR68_13410 [Bacteroidales bacterium]|nr:hypothetical protein [Bacteroidales bacterium]